MIQSRFLAGWNTTLNTNIMFATRARRAVENARLSLDATKGSVRNITGQGMNPDTEQISGEKRAEIEQKEDEFVGQTEEAVGVMKNVSGNKIFSQCGITFEKVSIGRNCSILRTWQ